MAKKRITLPKDFEEIMEHNDISELAKVYETCDINAYERDWMKTPTLCMYGISKEFIDWLVKTVQGEVIRICGKVAHEIIDNGACNWSRDYRKLPQALPAYFAMGNPIPATDFSPSPTPSRQQDENEELTDLAKGIHAGSTEDDFNRLQELAVKWVLANPMSIKLGKVGYRR